MTTVLGIDAAWTAREPSGVALVRKNQGRWQVLGVQPSYNAFIQAAENQPFDWKIKSVPGCVPDMGRLLALLKPWQENRFRLSPLTCPYPGCLFIPAGPQTTKYQRLSQAGGVPRTAQPGTGRESWGTISPVFCWHPDMTML